MSSLWTPGGERPVGGGQGGQGGQSGPGPGGGQGGQGGPHDHGPHDHGDPEGGLDAANREQLEAELAEMHRQIAEAPAAAVIANHAIGLFQLAGVHLSQQPPHLDDARLAVDALAALVEGLAGRLGPDEPTLKDALAQIQLAFVQIQAGATAPPSGDPGPGPQA
jgi:hypothetical protein